jgi:hypothetical protein
MKLKKFEQSHPKLWYTSHDNPSMDPFLCKLNNDPSAVWRGLRKYY